MKEVTIFNESFDLKEVTKENTIQSLDMYEEYMDFAINSTISKQMPNLPEEQERYWANVLITNYLNGDENAFTSTFGIRKNINECGQNKVAEMLIKAAIERNAFEQSVMRKLIPENELEFICEDIIKKVYSGNYLEVVNLVKTNPVYQKNLVNNYVGFKYRSSIKPEINCAREDIGLARMTLNNLEYGMRRYSQNGHESHSGVHR